MDTHTNTQITYIDNNMSQILQDDEWVKAPLPQKVSLFDINIHKQFPEKFALDYKLTEQVYFSQSQICMDEILHKREKELAAREKAVLIKEKAFKKHNIKNTKKRFEKKNDIKLEKSIQFMVNMMSDKRVIKASRNIIPNIEQLMSRVSEIETQLRRIRGGVLKSLELQHIAHNTTYNDCDTTPGQMQDQHIEINEIAESSAS